MHIFSIMPSLNLTISTLQSMIPYIGMIFSRRAILAKMIPGRCVNCSLSPIFAFRRVVNRDLLQCLILAMCIFSDLEEFTNSAKIKPSWKIPDIRYISQIHNGTDMRNGPTVRHQCHWQTRQGILHTISIPLPWDHPFSCPSVRDQILASGAQWIWDFKLRIGSLSLDYNKHRLFT